MILKCIWKSKEPGIARARTFLKKSVAERVRAWAEGKLSPVNFGTFYGASGNRARKWTNTSVELRYIRGMANQTRGERKNQKERMLLLTRKKMKLDPYLHTIYKIHARWMKDFNSKTKLCKMYFRYF